MLDLALARQSGYPVTEFKDLQRLTLRYQRRERPFTVEMDARERAREPQPRGHLPLRRERRRLGQPVLRLAPARQPAGRRDPQPLGRTGAGRADARIVEGLAAMGNALGIDCWGPDGRATYVLREYGRRREEGVATDCVFPAPLIRARAVRPAPIRERGR